MSFSTYVRRLGEPVFALLLGSAITYLIHENTYLTVNEGTFILFAVTAVGYGLLMLFTHRGG